MATFQAATRTEHDSFGAIEVPAERAVGRADRSARCAHFAISTERMPDELVHALARVKRGLRARSTASSACWQPDKAAAIAAAAQRGAGRPRMRGEFPLSVWQTGSGTQSNMNMNEVLANRASRAARRRARAPGAACIPTTTSTSASRPTTSSPPPCTSPRRWRSRGACCRRWARCAATLAAKAAAFADIVKIGRTHLQDATPLTLGQEFSGYVAQLDARRASHRRAALAALYALAIGGTAVGTGLNTHPEFGARVAAALAARQRAALRQRRQPVRGAGRARRAGGRARRAEDAGDRADEDRQRHPLAGLRAALPGSARLRLPENEPGSSIMPGKVNPTQCEALTMVCCQVMGNDVAIGIGGASGNFELNVYKPLIAHNFLQSVRLLADGMASFDAHCVRGIEAEPGAHRRTAGALADAGDGADAAHRLRPRRARSPSRRTTTARTLREAALALGYVTAEEFDRWVRPEDMV